jgi:hypothetical protein
MNTTTTLGPCFSVLLAASFLSPPVTGLDYPLSSGAMREACFLGSGDPEKLVVSLEKYAMHYPVAKSGQCVASLASRLSEEL